MLERRTALDFMYHQAFLEKTENSLLAAEKAFEEYLVHDPLNTEMLLSFAIFLYFYLHDWPKSLEYLYKIIAIEPHHPYALFAIAYFKSMWRPDIIEPDLFEQLAYVVSTNDNAEIKSMGELALGWLYQIQDNNQQYEECLLRSVKYYKYHVKNFIFLAELNMRRNNFAAARYYVTMGINNVQLIDVFNGKGIIEEIIPNFIDEYFKGTDAVSINVNRWRSWVQKIDQQGIQAS